jgi:hypothetical protein
MPNDALMVEDDPTIALGFALLRNALSSTTNTYFSTELSDGERSLCMVRRTVIIDRR